MSFDFKPTQIDDVIVIEPEVHEDERGFLLESYDQDEFAENGLPTNFVLEFYSESKQRVIRGLHHQINPHRQAKIVRCFDGKIFDVAIDVRPDSDTFGEYISHRLTGENKHALYIPRGFLHGFATLSGSAVVHYKLDNQYAPNYEHGVRWDDPEIGIDWPIDSPIVSEKDQQWPGLQESIYVRD